MNSDTGSKAGNYRFVQQLTNSDKKTRQDNKADI